MNPSLMSEFLQIRRTARADARWLLQQARPRRLRSMLRFAEQEIIVPSGPYEGRRFLAGRQPYSRLWFDEVDSGRWSRCVATGPTQSGKTLCCFVIPLIYHLFEIAETVICGLPDMDMAGDKWREDLLPVIEHSRYRELLPRRGGGSRGGRVETIQFGNGATLKFMSGGGGDKSRAGFTSRVVVITETDGMDKAGNTSRESDKVTQLEARTRAYGSRKRIYMECTVSTEQGRTWQEYQHGSRSRVMLLCPLCNAYVCPEREHLTGWQGAESQVQARRAGAFACPACSQIWSPEQRNEANRKSLLLHEGQMIDKGGTVSGDLPSTDTLGFRWSGVNNLFLLPADLAADEWRASHAVDEESAEREMKQFVWCLPVQPTQLQQTPLELHELANRMLPLARGIAPKESLCITMGIDLGKYLAHWIAVAWKEGASGHILDYGRVEVPSDDMGVEQATMVTLRQLRDMVLKGWPKESPTGPALIPSYVFIDAGYQTPVVYAFCREAGFKFRPAVGRGTGQQRDVSIGRINQTGSTVVYQGEGHHGVNLPAEKLILLEIDADYWKSWVHQRLVTPIDKPGAMTLFNAQPMEHLALAKHLTAEQKIEEFVVGKGVVTRWERLRKQNHWFDALYNSCVAGYCSNIRLVQEQVPAPPPAPKTEWTNPLRRDRPFLDWKQIRQECRERKWW